MKRTRYKRLFVMQKYDAYGCFERFFLHKQRCDYFQKMEENMENIIFGIMVVIALGAGVFTCIYEIGGKPKKNTEHQKNDIEKGTN